MLTGYSTPPHWKKLAVAPHTLQTRVLELIEREAAKARRGEPARIVAKLNALVDATTIRALYGASQAGVEIELMVRGICCLRPGVPGVSERIRVRSVVDRFLEHSRAMAFGVGPQAEVYLSSADWMPRNFHRRIEVMFPVEDPAAKARILEEVLGLGLRDNVKARQLLSDGAYAPVPLQLDGAAVRSQTTLIDLARRGDQKAIAVRVLRHFVSPGQAQAHAQAQAAQADAPARIPGGTGTTG
jgi:polyphosphate kinase